MIPVTVETTMSAVSRIDDLNALLEQVGNHFEVFGNTTLLCRELPIWLKDTKEEDLFTGYDRPLAKGR